MAEFLIICNSFNLFLFSFIIRFVIPLTVLATTFSFSASAFLMTLSVIPLTVLATTLLLAKIPFIFFIAPFNVLPLFKLFNIFSWSDLFNDLNFSSSDNCFLRSLITCLLTFVPLLFKISWNMFVAFCAALLTDFLALATIVFVALAFGALFILFKKFCLFLFGSCNLFTSERALFLITNNSFNFSAATPVAATPTATPTAVAAGVFFLFEPLACINNISSSTDETAFDIFCS